MSDSVQEKILSPFFFYHLGIFHKDLTNVLIVFFPSRHGMNDSVANNYVKLGFAF